jgi:transcription elongation factor GreA
MKKYLTKEKKKQLEQELEECKTSVRFEIGERLKRAKDMGDLSENADYTDAKDIQLANEKRILELEDIIHSAEVIKETNDFSIGRVQIGSRIKVKNDDGEKEFKIVGSYDANPRENLISNESPIGKAFIDKKIGDEVIVKTPSRDIKYTIISIE